MGTGKSGRYLNTRGSANKTSAFGHTISDNLPEVIKQHPLTPGGYFGKQGSRTSVRRIESTTPLTTAKVFFDRLSYGGKIEALPNGKGQKATMKDGSTIVYRPVSSSDGSPAAEIRCLLKNSKVKEQKIHFIKDKKR